MLNPQASYSVTFRLIIALFACAVCNQVWSASELYLEGQMVQGGLVQGIVPAGTTVEIDGEAVRVSASGVFLLGFHRDDREDVIVEATFPDGTRERRSLSIRVREYNIQRIDGLPKKKVTPDESVLARIAKEVELVKATRRRDDDRSDFLTGFMWPAKGPISGVYGSQRILNGQPRQPHYGVDIAVPVGTEVHAPADGVITLVHDDMYFSGGTLVLDHGHGLSSAFLHLSRILVKQGDAIRRGDPIALVGATGRVTGPHLDWRMNLFDKRIDPALLVEPMNE